MVMAARTQRLPIVFIPKKFLIPAMRDDMVNYRCRCDFSIPHTLCAQRVALQEAGAGFSPAAIIATVFSTAAPAVSGKLHMF